MCNVIILAAGNGSRMSSELPKVMHPIAKKPLLVHVVETAQELNPSNIFVIYGPDHENMREQMADLPVKWVMQEQQLGTGHAVAQALPYCNDDNVLVLYGDVPLISTKTLLQLLDETPLNGLGLVVTELDDPAGFGRIVRNEMGNITKIVEHKDASALERDIQEINTGILTTTVEHLRNWLPSLDNKNKQHEYYLTDIVSLAVDQGVPVGGVMAHCVQEVQGVNDRWQQATLERSYQLSQAKSLVLSGVSVMDPYRLDVRGDIDVGLDTTIDVNVILEGRVEIGVGCKIGANVILKDVVLGDYVEVLPHSMIEGAIIDTHACVGPFARIRPGSHIEQGARVGNFVEMKKSTLGKGSKASHLSYLGDAHIGQNVNIGAGTITCNYDGLNKHKTYVADHAFIGSNSALVAPVSIGEYATIGAGSVITQDAKAHQLTVSRAKQMTVAHWKRPEKVTAE